MHIGYRYHVLTCFLLADLTAFIEISESTFVFPAVLNVTFLPSFIVVSLILSITIFDRIVPFRDLDRYTTSSLSSCGVIIIGEFASFSSVAESISNSLNLLSHSSSLSRTSRLSGSVETYFQNRLGPVALNHCPDLFHEGYSVHTASRPIYVVSMMNFPLFFGQHSQERYSGSAFYSSSPW